MELEVKYIFPTSTPGVNNYIYKLPEGLGMRRILPHRIHKPGRTLHVGPKFNLNFINGITNPEIVY